VQARIGRYRVDVLAVDDKTQLAIEVDGLAFHRATQLQMAADYRRERRLVEAGLVVVRFTAAEVFADAAACWREVFAILRQLAARRRSA